MLLTLCSVTCILSVQFNKHFIHLFVHLFIILLISIICIYFLQYIPVTFSGSVPSSFLERGKSDSRFPPVSSSAVVCLLFACFLIYFLLIYYCILFLPKRVKVEVPWSRAIWANHKSLMRREAPLPRLKLLGRLALVIVLFSIYQPSLSLNAVTYAAASLLQLISANLFNLAAL
jgi:hypothetical protein